MAEDDDSIAKEATVSFIGILLSTVSVLTGLLSIESGATSVNRMAYKALPSKLPTLPEMIQMAFLGLIDKNEAVEYGKELGFSGDWGEKLVQIQRNRLNIHDLMTAKFREYIDEGRLAEHPSVVGYKQEDLELTEELHYYFPPVPDLIRFAVREVYSSGIRSAFGMDEDRPPDFMKESKHAGLREQHAKDYWAAHWDLPSARQGFEMLHRGVIDESDLKLLLRALDFMPYWRDKLVEISYNPFTRVDVRRMYRLGVLTEDEVLKSYKDLGYDDEKAGKLSEFTFKYENADVVGITKGNILKAFKEYLMDESELEDYLEKLGFNENARGFWLDIANYEREKEKLDTEIDELIALYRIGEIKIDKVRSELNRFNLPSEYIDQAIKKELGQLSKRRKMPTRTDLGNWLKKGIISQGDYINKLVMLGYSKDDSLRYLEDIGLSE